MKRLVVILTAAVMGLFAVATMADAAIGVVDMQNIYQNAAQVKKIQDDLKKQFEPRRAAIISMGKQLQDEIQTYQKNKAVMSKADLDTLQKKIEKQEMELRQKQTQFQQDAYSAQNKEMGTFMDQLRNATKTVATSKGMTLVIAKNSTLYSGDNLDITKEVLSKLQ